MTRPWARALRILVRRGDARTERRQKPASLTAKALFGASNPQVVMFRWATVVAILFPLALVVSPSASLGAASQSSTDVPDVSLERIREQLKRTSTSRLLDTPLPRPVATFRSGVEQRVFVLTLEEQLRKDFTLTALQRQSAEWASRCCGISLSQLFNSAERALQRRQVRRIRQQIARELAELEAARQK